MSYNLYQFSEKNAYNTNLISFPNVQYGLDGNPYFQQDKAQVYPEEYKPRNNSENKSKNIFLQQGEKINYITPHTTKNVGKNEYLKKMNSNLNHKNQSSVTNLQTKDYSENKINSLKQDNQQYQQKSGPFQNVFNQVEETGRSNHFSGKLDNYNSNSQSYLQQYQKDYDLYNRNKQDETSFKNGWITNRFLGKNENQNSPFDDYSKFNQDQNQTNSNSTQGRNQQIGQNSINNSRMYINQSEQLYAKFFDSQPPQQQQKKRELQDQRKNYNLYLTNYNNNYKESSLREQYSNQFHSPEQEKLLYDKKTYKDIVQPYKNMNIRSELQKNFQNNQVKPVHQIFISPNKYPSYEDEISLKLQHCQQNSNNNQNINPFYMNEQKKNFSPLKKSIEPPLKGQQNKKNQSRLSQSYYNSIYSSSNNRGQVLNNQPLTIKQQNRKNEDHFFIQNMNSLNENTSREHYQLHPDYSKLRNSHINQNDREDMKKIYQQKHSDDPTISKFEKQAVQYSRPNLSLKILISFEKQSSSQNS